jgi:hypothetical protein
MRTPSHTLSALALALSLLPFLPTPASAAWTHDAVNGGVPVAVVNYAPSGPVALSDGPLCQRT